MQRAILIDLSALFWRAWHSSGEADITHARARTLESVRKIVGEGNDLVGICCDAGKSFRKDLYPAYKANRPDKDSDAYGELDGVKAALRADGYLLWEAPGYEADDVIATATTGLRERQHPILVASADKDLLQLVCEGADFPGRTEVRCLRTHNWVDVGAAEVRASFGVNPHQIRDWLALVGDAADNIKGAPGVGPKTATILLAQYQDLKGIYDALATPNHGISDRVARSLIENREGIALAVALVTLVHDVPIDIGEMFYGRQVAPVAPIGDTHEFAPPPPAPPPPPSVPLADPTPSRALAGAEGTKSQAQGQLIPFRALPYELTLEPTSLPDAVVLAKAVFNSRLYSKFSNVDAVLMVILRGREMGLGALTALDCFHVIDGHPTLYAWLIIARAKAHPDCEYFYVVEASATSATWETKNRRNPRPTRITYTYAQAEAAQLPKQGSRGPNGWLKNPEDMLVKAGGAKLARREYPDAALGLYATEEFGGEGSNEWAA